MLAMFFYDIESRSEEKLECRFQVTKGDGSCVTLHDSQMCNNMEEVNKFKNTLTQEQQDCLEGLKCRSHQPTLLCVVNGAQSIKKHFYETVDSDVVNAFFKWMVDDVLKPTNVRREQKNDYMFVVYNGSAYDS